MTEPAQYTKILNFKVTPEEKDAIERGAARLGVSVSELCRSAALTAAGDPDPLEAAERAVREAQALVRALRRARDSRRG